MIIGMCPRCIEEQYYTGLQMVQERLSIICNACPSALLLQDGECHCGESWTYTSKSQHERWLENERKAVEELNSTEGF